MHADALFKIKKNKIKKLQKNHKVLQDIWWGQLLSQPVRAAGHCSPRSFQPSETSTTAISKEGKHWD